MVTIIPRPEKHDGNNPIRRPQQERSRQRFEAILDSAERLLDELEPQDISIYTLAEESGISPASIYHFFPDAGHVFIALAERFFQSFLGLFETPMEQLPTSWQELLAARYAEGAEYYNSHKAARKLLLGSGLAAAIRSRDMEIDQQLAALSIKELSRYFILPEIPDFIERYTEVLVINDALWALSVHREGYITPEMEEQARRARDAYCRTFLPEYLSLREQEGTADD